MSDRCGGEAAMTPKVVIVQPDVLCPPSELGRWLDEEKVSWTCVRPFDGDAVPALLDAHGLVVLGGDMSSLDDGDYPWLEDIRALQRAAAERGQPSLGICLGAQLMAQAFGGGTAVGDRGLEAGVAEVGWLPGAQDDSLVAGLASPFVAGTMHSDAVVVLPADAVRLGSGDMYPNQVFRVGQCSWGVQFHPEINHGVYQSWVDATGTEPQKRQAMLVGGEELLEVEDLVLRANQELVRNFASVVRRAATGGEWE